MTTSLPQDILDRCERVFQYHQASQYTYDSVRALPNLDWASQPSVFRALDELPKVALETHLLDVPAATLNLLRSGLDALPESQVDPPQDIKTLSTWLYLSDGLISKLNVGTRSEYLRTTPSNGALYPCETYVAAFAIDGLEPGLYHYSPREFALRKMRDGQAALAQIKRGRPDLEFLKTVPAALLVSTNFWRCAWRFRERAYRYALFDAGHLVQNLCTAATGLGMQTRTRLTMNHNTTRELIGIAPDADFGQVEAVQAMVVWNDPAQSPLPVARTNGNGAGNGGAAAAGMQPIARKPLSAQVTSYASITACHDACVAPGVAVREVRPPVTEGNPVSAPETSQLDLKLTSDDLLAGDPLRKVLLQRKPMRDFARQSISRDQFLILNRRGFCGGTFFPLLPDGPHAALVRPFWIVHDVTGMDSGVWYYHPPNDRWVQFNPGHLRLEAQYLSVEQPICGNAAAVCFMMVDFWGLMLQAGPDTYRLAHLEAGVVAQRILLAANAMGLGCATNGAFYDEEVRQFLGLEQTGWQAAYELAVGVNVEDAQQVPDVTPKFKDEDWRD